MDFEFKARNEHPEFAYFRELFKGFLLMIFQLKSEIDSLRLQVNGLYSKDIKRIMY